MKIWAWIRIKDNRELITWTATGIVGLVGALWTAYTFFFNSGDTASTQAPPAAISTGNIQSQGDLIVGSGDITTHITHNHGISFEEHKAHLSEKEDEVRQLLVANIQSTEELESALERLAEVEHRSAEKELLHNARVQELQKRIARLDQLAKQVPNNILDKAKTALAEGDNAKAKRLFIRLKEQKTKIAEADYQLGKLAEETNQYSEAANYYESALQLNSNVSAYLEAAGMAAYQLGQIDKAIAYMERSLNTKDVVAIVSRDMLRVPAMVHYYLGEAWFDKGNFDKASEYYEQFFVNFKDFLGYECPLAGFIYYRIGETWFDQKSWDKSIYFYEKALVSTSKLFGENNFLKPPIQLALAVAWTNKGEHEKEIKYYQQFLTGALQLFGEEHILIAQTYFLLGTAWKNTGELNQAIMAYEKASAVISQIPDKNPTLAIQIDFFLASALQNTGELDKAIAYYEKLLAAELLDKNSQIVALTHHYLALAWEDKKELDKALFYHEQFLVSGARAFGENHKLIYYTHALIALAWQDKGELDKTIELYERGLTAVINIYGEDHPNVAIIRQKLGNAWIVNGESEKGFEILEKAYEKLDPPLASTYRKLGEVLKSTKSSTSQNESRDTIPN